VSAGGYNGSRPAIGGANILSANIRSGNILSANIRLTCTARRARRWMRLCSRAGRKKAPQTPVGQVTQGEDFIPRSRLAALASRARGYRVAGGLRAGFHVAEQVVGPHPVVPPALSVLLDRAAAPDLLCRSGRPGGHCHDGDGCDCDGEVAHGHFSLSGQIAVIF
jgi:hypothetical protein